MRTLIWMLVCVVLGFGVLAGSAAAQGDDPTATPQGTVLFEDNFATYSQRWEEKVSPKAAVTYREFALNMQIVSPGVQLWSVPDFEAPLYDYTAQVVAEVRGGGPDAYFGFVVNYVDDDNFTVAMASPSGEWEIGRYAEGEWEDLTPEDAVPVERDPEQVYVDLRVIVTGESVALWVDDLEAGTVPVESSDEGGMFGLVAQAGMGFIDVSFDDMLVRDYDAEANGG